MNIRLLSLIVAILTGIAVPVLGQMYKWTDEKGGIHFTDDRSKIPEQYHPKVESREIPQAAPPSEAGPSPNHLSIEAVEPEKFHADLIRKQGVWLVDVVLNHRVKRRFVVDTGASFTLISQKTAEEIGIIIDENTLFVPGMTVSGTIFTPLVILKSIQVGNAELDNVEALVYDMPSDHDGLLGNSFLSKFGVVLDSVNGKLTLVSMKENIPDRPGGFGRDYWSGRFRFYREILEDLEWLKREYETQRRNAEVDRIERAIQFFQNQLAELERRASYAGVPRNWRQ